MQVEYPIWQFLLVATTFFAFSSVAWAQRVSLLVPEPESPASRIATAVESEIPSPLILINHDLADAAFRAVAPAEPFNMTIADAANVGKAIGGDYLVILRSKSQRRADRGDDYYYDAFAAIYVVNARTGDMIAWDIRTSRAPTAEASEKLLTQKASSIAQSIAAAIRDYQALSIPLRINPGNAPDENSPDSRGFRPPAPYRKITPKYTEVADLYAVEATVDIEVDFDIEGKITATRIVRWAGFGLDQSVDSTVRAMQWRPAYQNGKPRPIRVLLRYNFRKQPVPGTK